MKVGSADSGCGCSDKGELGSAEKLFEQLAGENGKLSVKELVDGLDGIAGKDGNENSFSSKELEELLNAAGVPDRKADKIFDALAKGEDEVNVADVVEVALGQIGEDGTWDEEQFTEVLGDIKSAGQFA